MNEKKLFENFVFVSKRFDNNTKFLQSNRNFFLVQIGQKRRLIDWTGDAVLDFCSDTNDCSEIRLTQSGYVLLHKTGSDSGVYYMMQPNRKFCPYQISGFTEYPDDYVLVEADKNSGLGNRYFVLGKNCRTTISAYEIEVFADKMAMIRRSPYSTWSLVMLNGETLISGIEKYSFSDADSKIRITYTDGVDVKGFSAMACAKKPTSLIVDENSCIVIYYSHGDEHSECVVTNGKSMIRFQSAVRPVGNELCIAEERTDRGNVEKSLYRLSDGKLVGSVWDAKMNNKSGAYAYLKGSWTVCSKSGQVLPLPPAAEVELFDNGDVGYRKSYASDMMLHRRGNETSKVNIGRGVATYCKQEDIAYDMAFCGGTFLLKKGENNVNCLISPTNSLDFSAEDVFPIAKDKIVLKMNNRYALYDKDLKCLGVSEEKIEALPDGAVKLFDKDGKITFVTAKGTVVEDKVDDALSSGPNIALIVKNKCYILFEK